MTPIIIILLAAMLVTPVAAVAAVAVYVLRQQSHAHRVELEKLRRSEPSKTEVKD